MQEIRARSLGREGPLEKEMATHSNILAWEISRTEKPGRLQSMGLQEVNTTEQLRPTNRCITLQQGTPWVSLLLNLVHFTVWQGHGSEDSRLSKLLSCSLSWALAQYLYEWAPNFWSGHFRSQFIRDYTLLLHAYSPQITVRHLHTQASVLFWKHTVLFCPGTSAHAVLFV